MFDYETPIHKSLIEPKAERVLSTEKKYELGKGESFIVLEEKSKKVFDIFVDFVNHGVCGLCLTRVFPKILKESYGFEKTSILWLTTLNVEEGISPKDLKRLEYLIQEFLKMTKNSIILLDGLEYLVVMNNFKKVLKFLNNVVDAVALKSSNLLVSICPDTFYQNELEFLRRKFRIL
ncbi:MAG: DUF835 domain-containing protein [Candidatus Methanofastidiosia archaeon]